MRAPWSASAQSHTLRNPMKRSTFLQLLLSLGVALGAAGIARAEGEAAAQKRAEAKAMAGWRYVFRRLRALWRADGIHDEIAEERKVITALGIRK